MHVELQQKVGFPGCEKGQEDFLEAVSIEQRSEGKMRRIGGERRVERMKILNTEGNPSKHALFLLLSL